MSETISIDRQTVDSKHPVEFELRKKDAAQLVHEIIDPHREFFADPQNRLDFIKEQSGDDFLRMAQYINAKLRGEKPHQVRHDDNETGKYATLSLDHTPSLQDKPIAFKNGYEEIRRYIEMSPDSIEKKIEGVAMATEALIRWVHPFTDGNGRTSRFLGKLIDDGAANTDELVQDTITEGTRRRVYTMEIETREALLAVANSEAMAIDEAEREELREQAMNLPPDVEGVALNIKRLLEDDTVRQKALRFAK